MLFHHKPLLCERQYIMLSTSIYHKRHCSELKHIYCQATLWMALQQFVCVCDVCVHIRTVCVLCCIHTHTHTCTHTHTHARACAGMYVHMQTHTCIHAHTHTYVHTHIYRRIFTRDDHNCGQSFIHTRIRTIPKQLTQKRPLPSYCSLYVCTKYWRIAML